MTDKKLDTAVPLNTKHLEAQGYELSFLGRTLGVTRQQVMKAIQAFGGDPKKIVEFLSKARK
jgi:hypothetical protein